MKIPFPFSGTGMGVENSIPDFRDGNWRPVFPGIPGIGNSRSWLYHIVHMTLVFSPVCKKLMELQEWRFFYTENDLIKTLLAHGSHRDAFLQCGKAYGASRRGLC